MKELNFNTSSWHYRLAKMGGYGPRTHSPDICTYTKSILKTLFFGVLIGVIIGLFGFLFFQVFFGLIFSLIYWTWIMSEIGTNILGAIGAIVLIVTSVIGGMLLMSGCSHLRNKIRNNLENKSDGFIGNAYKSWKDKFCMRINFSDKKE